MLSEGGATLFISILFRKHNQALRPAAPSALIESYPRYGFREVD